MQSLNMYVQVVATPHHYITQFFTREWMGGFSAIRETLIISPWLLVKRTEGLHIGRPPDLYNKEHCHTLAYGNQQKNQLILNNKMLKTLLWLAVAGSCTPLPPALLLSPYYCIHTAHSLSVKEGNIRIKDVYQSCLEETIYQS